MESKDTCNKTLTGILIPENWDENGNVIGISIQAFDESEYIVKAGRRGKKLFDFINHKVKVTGKMFERSDGKLFIEVNRFEVLDS
ncbi:MAG: hypothetical protein KKH68_09530 [Proteobacteria bacterium]|nr:hypothetical protein [Pseudomonadota bacterium]